MYLGYCLTLRLGGESDYKAGRTKLRPASFQSTSALHFVHEFTFMTFPSFSVTRKRGGEKNYKNSKEEKRKRGKVKEAYWQGRHGTGYQTKENGAKWKGGRSMERYWSNEGGCEAGTEGADNDPPDHTT